MSVTTATGLPREIGTAAGAGEYAAFQPRAGDAMSNDDLRVIEAQQFLRSIADRRLSGPGCPTRSPVPWLWTP